jgi:hypothetical protein
MQQQQQQQQPLPQTQQQQQQKQPHVSKKHSPIKMKSPKKASPPKKNNNEGVSSPSKPVRMNSPFKLSRSTKDTNKINNKESSKSNVSKEEKEGNDSVNYDNNGRKLVTLEQFHSSLEDSSSGNYYQFDYY